MVVISTDREHVSRQAEDEHSKGDPNTFLSSNMTGTVRLKQLEW